MRRVFLLPALLLFLVGPGFAADATAARTAYPYVFQLGFATITNLLLTDDIALAPLDNEGHNPQNGDGLQHAISIKVGKPILLVWRKIDNWTATTDGYVTWVNGPNGLQKRFNTERFSFEANPDMLAIASGLPLAAATGGGITAAAYAALLSQYEQAHPAFQRHVLGDMSTMPTEPPAGGLPLPNFDWDQPQNRLAAQQTYLATIPWGVLPGQTAVIQSGRLANYDIVNGNVVLYLNLDKNNPNQATAITINLQNTQSKISFGSDVQGMNNITSYSTNDPIHVIEAINYYVGGIGAGLTFENDDVITRSMGGSTALIGFD